jgi:hypothetical protein
MISDHRHERNPCWIWVSGRNLSARVSPPKLGGVAAAVRKFRASSLAPQTGWFQSRHVSKCILEAFRQGNHPVRSAKDASQYFFGRGHPS